MLKKFFIVTLVICCFVFSGCDEDKVDIVHGNGDATRITRTVVNPGLTELRIDRVTRDQRQGEAFRRFIGQLILSIFE